MCLYAISERLVAKKDIICYKNIVKFNENVVRKKYKEGEEFTGIINGIKCSGKIHFESTIGYTEPSIYFCTNEKLLNGSSCKDTLGYNYSWIFGLLVTELNKFNNPIVYYTPIRNMRIKIGKTYKGKLENNKHRIDKGFHAYTKKNIESVNVKCIIPKGSEYYLGDYNEIVSNCIKYEKLL